MSENKITITVEAATVPELAAKLSDLHRQFSAIADVMTMALPTGEKVALANTPLEDAIAVVKEREASPPPPPPAPQAQAPRGRGRKPAADKEKAPPTDRFFEDDATAEAPSPTAPAAPAAGGASGAPKEVEPYHVEVPTEPLYLNLRAKAKLYFDEHGQDGENGLAKVWTDNWAFIMGDKLADFPAPSIKALDGQREAIVRALSVFDPLTGHDPITGERGPASSSAAADLL